MTSATAATAAEIPYATSMPAAVDSTGPASAFAAVTMVITVTMSAVLTAPPTWRPVLLMALPCAIMSFGSALMPQVVTGMFASVRPEDWMT